MLQNALKVFEGMPADLISMVRQTDPTTVTQHGLYMRPMTETHPWAIPQFPKAPALPRTPEPPGTPLKQAEAPLAASNGASPDAYGRSVMPRQAGQSTRSNPEAGAPAGEASVEAATLNGAPSAVKQAEASSQGASVEAVTAPHAATSVPDAKHGAAAVPDTNGASAVGAGTRAVADGARAVADGAWGRGRVTLLGDAAHATIPNGMYRPASTACPLCLPAAMLPKASCSESAHSWF